MIHLSEEAVGRLDAATLDDKPTTFDTPNKTAKAIITKLDQIIAWQNLVGTAIATATDAASLYTALNVTATKAALKKLRFTL